MILVRREVLSRAAKSIGYTKHGVNLTSDVFRAIFLPEAL